MNTNEILAEAMSLWPSNETKPHFKWFKPNEWCCSDGYDPCGYASTLEEALYRYAIICQRYDDRFGKVISFLSDYVPDALMIDEDEKTIGPFRGMNKIVNNFFQP
jgi:hypothetical protein